MDRIIRFGCPSQVIGLLRAPSVLIKAKEMSSSPAESGRRGKPNLLGIDRRGSATAAARSKISPIVVFRIFPFEPFLGGNIRVMRMNYNQLEAMINNSSGSGLLQLPSRIDMITFRI